MNPVMLGDFSARSMGMTLADHVHLQRTSATRYRRRTRATRHGVRRAAEALRRGTSARDTGVIDAPRMPDPTDAGAGQLSARRREPAADVAASR